MIKDTLRWLLRDARVGFTSIVLVLFGFLYALIWVVKRIAGARIESTIKSQADKLGTWAAQAPITDLLYWSVWVVLALILICAAVAWMLSVLRQLAGISGRTTGDTPGASPLVALRSPYNPSWDSNDIFTLEEASHLWVGEEPLNPTPPGARAYPVLQRLIEAINQEKLAEWTGSLGDNAAEPWSRKVRRKELLDYCLNSRYRPDFLFSEIENTCIIMTFSGETATATRGTNLKGWSGTGRRRQVQFETEIPPKSQVFYVSEVDTARCRPIRQSDSSVTFQIDQFAPRIRITFGSCPPDRFGPFPIT